MLSKMLGRTVGLLAMAGMLSGCSAWEGTMSGLGLYDTDSPAPVVARDTAVPSPAAAPASDSWCQKVATQDRAEAAQNGFDVATQQRRYAVSYRQCLAVQADAGQ